MDFLVQFHFLFGVFDLVFGQFGNVEQSLQFFFEFHEHAEVSDLGNLAHNDVGRLVFFGNPRFPRVLVKLFQSQGDAFAIFVD